MSYHNLDTVIQNLDIFKHTYVISGIIKLTQKRGVYLVHDTRDDQQKVMKFLIRSSITDEQMDIFHFFMSCRHPNLCRITDIFECGLFLVIVMDYIQGPTLCQFFKEDRDRVDYYKVFFELILCLKFLHDNKIIHGDVKPINILIKSNNTPVLIDYDLCKYSDGIGHVDRSFGTKLFMSPEIIANKRFSSKSDIWSMGMSIFILVMRKYIPDIVTRFPTDCVNDIMCSSSNNKIKIVGDILSIYEKTISKDYGILFVNMMLVMLLEDDTLRPTSSELTDVIRKSKYFGLLYNDIESDIESVYLSHARKFSLNVSIKGNVIGTSVVKSVTDHTRIKKSDIIKHYTL